MLGRPKHIGRPPCNPTSCGCLEGGLGMTTVRGPAQLPCMPSTVNKALRLALCRPHNAHAQGSSISAGSHERDDDSNNHCDFTRASRLLTSIPNRHRHLPKVQAGHEANHDRAPRRKRCSTQSPQAMRKPSSIFDVMRTDGGTNNLSANVASNASQSRVHWLRTAMLQHVSEVESGS